ncbi:response regulator [Cohnella nanjingensis]|uniref:Response regulator n=1 Tax=Cohnella nanjingensis TaxID=1387779 RepID=A0A7X0RZQ7_9BACL|nr:response regulator [Cohnella nanjingensis]MBB6675049.1 response regulator [Cohnella nanjingensis]
MRQLLIIDDQSILADDLAEMLPWGEIGIDVVHKAYSGSEALDILKEQAVDVVVTDIRMPGMSGLELIARIRSNWKHTKCILLSGYSDFEYAKQALQLQSSDYLLKPAADEELMGAVRKALQELDREWLEVSSLQRAMYTLREQQPKLREYLLLDLINGKQSPRSKSLQRRMETYDVPLREADAFHLLLVRLDDAESGEDSGQGELIDYALANMAEEVFSDRFAFWHGKDQHGFLVCLIAAQNGEAGLDDDGGPDAWIESRALRLQHAARTYLRVSLSILSTRSGAFPEDAATLYPAAVAGFRRLIGRHRELYVSLSRTPIQHPPILLYELYRPPTLSTLLEIGQWEQVEDKLRRIFEELETDGQASSARIQEAYYVMAAAWASLSHKNKQSLFDPAGDGAIALTDGQAAASMEELRAWTWRILHYFRQLESAEDKDSRANIIKQVQSFIQRNLEEASLQAIAASVFLNPSYLSKIYKMETGEGISDYVFRARMERAAALLAQSAEKIYDISQSLGYQKPSYFIQLFKKHYGLTPQEYRNKLG